MRKISIIAVLLFNFSLLNAQNYKLDAGNDLYLNCFDEVQLNAKIINWTNKYISNIEIKSICFANDTIGFATGGQWNKGVIYKTADGGETWSEIKNVNYFLEDVFFLNKDTGFVVGGVYSSEDVILRTTDGGVTWDLTNNNTYNILNSIFFCNDTVGYSVGENNRVLKTIDCGETWTFQDVESSFLTDIAFYDDNIGIIIGKNGVLLKTTDAGNTWNTINNFDIVVDLYSTAFIGNKSYIAGKEGLIISSEDFFETYTVLKTKTLSPLYDIKFLNNDTAIAVGNNVIITTTDGGNTWNREFSEYEGNFNCTSFLTNNKRYIVGGKLYEGRILSYSEIPENYDIEWIPDTYLSESDILNPVINPLQSLSYILKITDHSEFNLEDTLNITVYTPGIYAGKDTSLQVYDTIQIHGIAEVGRWEPDTKESETWFNKIHFINKDTGFIVAGQTMGAILKTTDGGKTWVHRILNNDIGLFDICFTNDSTGYAVGNSGTILKTTDYGENWYRSESNTTAHLSSVFFVNENLGFATGSPDVVLKTVNGGATWQVSTIPNAVDIKRIYFINKNKGFIVENYPWECSYYKTTDGGNTWQKVIIEDVYAGPVDFFFFNEQDGYMLGQIGGTIYIFKTNDGGETWEYNRFQRYNSVTYTSFVFTDKNTGYISSGIGEIFKTTDGGKSLYLWDQIGSNINDMFFIDENNAFAVGDGGLLIKYHAKENINYNWVPDYNISNGNLLNPYVFPEEPITYYFSASTNEGCYAEDDILINVIDSISPTIICPDNQVFNLTESQKEYIVSGTELDPVSMNDNYQISGFYNNINNSSSLKDAAFKSGTTSVIWTVIDNADNVGSCNFNVSVNKSEDNQPHVFPNPTNGDIYFSSENSIQKIVVTDITGKKLLEKFNILQNDSIDISNFEKGIYIITIQTDKAISSSIIIKE